jgi:hypothetical protein
MSSLAGLAKVQDAWRDVDHYNLNLNFLPMMMTNLSCLSCFQGDEKNQQAKFYNVSRNRSTTNVEIR